MIAQPSRRAWLRLVGGGLAASALAWRRGWGREAPLGIGLQLYTVRAAMARDLPGTLARVAEIGYREVEFAGYFEHPPVAVRRALAAAGLDAPAAHVGLPASDDEWKATLDAAASVGHRAVVIPWLPAERRADLEAWRATAGLLNALAGSARRSGLGFAYHNHDFDLRPIEGRVPLDLLLAATDPALVQIELDLYWVAKGGGDPMRYLASHPGRITMVHVKDITAPPEGRMVDPGEGVLDFPALLATGLRGGLRHAFVEHDAPADAFASARAGWRYLKGLGY